jgi:hypothetical protein
MWPCKTQPLQPHYFSQTTLDACTCLGGGVLLHDVNSLSSINISRKLQTGEGNNISGTLAYMLLGWIYIITPGKACQLHSLCILLVYVPFKPPSLSISITYKFLLTQIYIYIYISRLQSSYSNISVSLEMATYIYHRMSELFLLSLFVRSFMVASAGTFDEDFDMSWGDHRGNMLDKGKLLTLSLDRISGSGFQSKREYLFGRMDMQLKLVSGDSAGTVTAYYVNLYLYFLISSLLNYYIF